MMTENEMRAQLLELGAAIRSVLWDERAAHVRWCPGDGAAHEFLLTPWEATVEIRGPQAEPPIQAAQGSPGWVYVTSFTWNTSYPIRLWELDGTPRVDGPTYCAEHWTQGGITDGRAVHLFLSAVAGCEPHTSFFEAGFRVEVDA